MTRDSKTDDVRFKRKYLQRRLPIARRPPTLFRPPMCVACGTEAVAILEPDGACGDPACCPQASNIAYACPNMECGTTTEPA